MASPAQSIDELVLPLVTAAGLELWDVEVNPKVVRVLVDRPGGIDLEAVAGLARVVSAALDDHGELAPSHEYQLEVGSPGVERTLRTPRHYQRYIGTTVAVKTAVPVAGSRRLQGVLRAADDAGISIELDAGVQALRYEEIQRAHTVVFWGPVGKGAAPASVAGRPARIKDVAR
jgi:ribosome maturation factor RimP